MWTFWRKNNIRFGGEGGILVKMKGIFSGFLVKPLDHYSFEIVSIFSADIIVAV